MRRRWRRWSASMKPRSGGPPACGSVPCSARIWIRSTSCNRSTSRCSKGFGPTSSTSPGRTNSWPWRGDHPSQGRPGVETDEARTELNTHLTGTRRRRTYRGQPDPGRARSDDRGRTADGVDRILKETEPADQQLLQLRLEGFSTAEAARTRGRSRRAPRTLKLAPQKADRSRHSGGMALAEMRKLMKRLRKTLR